MALRTAPMEMPVRSTAAVLENQGPEEAAVKTDELLERRGWCMWECSELGGEAIVITRDTTVKGYPGGYPVYTEAEIAELCKADISTIRLVHEAKVAGAVIIRSKAC